MNSTAAHISHQDLVVESGIFSPAVEEPFPAWMDRYFGAAPVGDGYLVVGISFGGDQMYLARITRSGAVEADTYFSTPDGVVSPLIAAAFVATATAWSQS